MSIISSLLFDVDVLINGKPIKSYSHNGKLFIEAREGTEYTIKVRNGNWSRKLAICSVDGINVVSGEPAGKEDTGYVISGLQSYEVKGFRTSNDNVNAFKFSSKSNSYAAKSPQTDGDTSNCGVIGIRWYGEKVKPTPYVPYLPPFNPLRPKKRRIIEIEEEPYIYPWNDNPIIWGDGTGVQYGDLRATYSCSTDLTRGLKSLDGEVACSATSFDMGTEFSGKQINDTVSETSFERDGVEHEVVIYYASRSVLESWGVPLEKEAKVSFPSAFPSKFCKPPKK